MNATPKQIAYVLDLIQQAGYEKDWAAARDLIGDSMGRWKQDRDAASRLIDALKAKLEAQE